MAARRLEARIRGRVQGVGFRWWVRRRAEELGLSGWVMNEDDERAVRVVAEGPEERLDVLERQLRRGPDGARVEDVESVRAPASGEHRGFEIHRQ
ncbi:MAG: acylphosphatase [Chloroflexota bacterium]